ncbi:hypothetical protein GUJ93_ZPchr0004g39444 [Zizania palustris]|uniref:Uncharacterized protein n=1 Tax=Zizania palustris TaxID=103762 RepID=A0A8J5RX81_ZIZPA|nr:hypothetical protein GUJ93_ZPchr0004g39444 [Zizania palustris]
MASRPHGTEPSGITEGKGEEEAAGIVKLSGSSVPECSHLVLMMPAMQSPAAAVRKMLILCSYQSELGKLEMVTSVDGLMMFIREERDAHKKNVEAAS